AKGATPLIATGKGSETLVATGEGYLVTLNAQGKESRRVNVVAIVDGDRKRAEHPNEGVKEVPPVEYIEPETLGFAKERLSAKEIARWKPSQPGRDAFGQSFHTMEGKAELSGGPDAGDFFVHL